ncbi:MAG: hypothetical protein D6788_02280 [Planctomycetota bacterium]|nr:MAG: hypothetical protein D6788_02280 [Planctomycetota bacterium]
MGEDNLCRIYETRPAMCREYEPGECDYVGGDYGYDLLFTHPKQLEDYYHRKTGRRLGAPRPRDRRGLPVLRKRTCQSRT